MIEPQLPRRRGCLASLHWRSGDRLERAEVGVVQEPAPLEPRHEAEDLAVSLAGRPHHELGRRSGRTAALSQETSGELELGQEIAAEVLFFRQHTYVSIRRSFQVHGDAVGPLRRRLDLRGLGAGQELDVDVSGEALAASQDFERGQHPIGRARRPARDTGREEKSLSEAFTVSLHERGRRLFGRERGALDLRRRTSGIATGQRTGVGLLTA